MFTADDGNNNQHEFANIIANISESSNGSEAVLLNFESSVAGSLQRRMEFNPEQTVFNENGIDLDFRVESNDVANMIKLDGANNNVGIGATAPSATAFSVKPASVNPSLTVQNTASGSRLAGSVWMASSGGSDISSEGTQGMFAALLHFNTSSQSEIRIDLTTDAFRGGAVGTFWVSFGLGAQNTMGAGWLSITKPADGNFAIYWDQQISQGTSPTVTLTTTTANTTVLDAHLRIANYYSYLWHILCN